MQKLDDGLELNLQRLKFQCFYGLQISKGRFLPIKKAD